MFSGLILRQTDITKCFQGALTLWASEYSNVLCITQIIQNIRCGKTA